jgi:phage terminase large subunit
MGRRAAPKPEGKEIVWNAGKASEKQKEFFASRVLYTCYGGAKAGGKSWAVQTKAILGALTYPGIKILIVRKTFKDVDENHAQPILKRIPEEMRTWSRSSYTMSFPNGATIKFGHWSGEDSEDEYNGIEYDWIFVDECTQFSERMFRILAACLRGPNGIPKRMYLTCNPGGVGHRWVKRLFIDRDFKTNSQNPEENEDPDDYVFIPATVDDNTALSEKEKQAYKQALSMLPEDKRNAYRYGDWSAMGGAYFSTFSQKNICAPFKLPPHWQIYRSFDYGLDMFACMWWAVDEDGRSWCFREFEEKDLIVQDAAKKCLEHTMPKESVIITWAPPDMWSRQRDSGKTSAEIFMQNGLAVNKASNNRVQGHMAMLDMIAPMPVHDPYVKENFGDTLPGMMFFDTCKTVISDIEDIQSDDKDPNDCAKDPHDVTHTVDAVRYYAVSRVMKTEVPFDGADEDEDEGEDYETYLCGGDVTQSYINA